MRGSAGSSAATPQDIEFTLTPLAADRTPAGPPKRSTGTLHTDDTNRGHIEFDDTTSWQAEEISDDVLGWELRTDDAAIVLVEETWGHRAGDAFEIRPTPRHPFDTRHPRPTRPVIEDPDDSKPLGFVTITFDDRAKAQTVGDTLRFVIDHWMSDPTETVADLTPQLQDILDRVQQFLATNDSDHLWACPMCEETQCDDGCPLQTVRRET